MIPDEEDHLPSRYTITIELIYDGGRHRQIKKIMAQQTQALKGHAAMTLFAAVISVSFSLGHLAAPYITPAALTASRFLVAAILLGLAVSKLIEKKHMASAWRYLVVGGLLAGYFIMMFEALRITDPISTSAVFTLTPLMSALFGFILLRQITTPSMGIALLIAAAGALWVIFRGDTEALLGLKFGPGEQIFFIGCAMHALYTPMGRLLNRGEPLMVYAFASICGGLMVAGLYGAPEILSTDWLNLPMVAWVAIFYLGIGATAGTVYLVQYATLRLPSAKVMAYGYLVPVFVILWEGLLGHGWVALVVVPGLVAIIVALVFLITDKH